VNVTLPTLHRPSRVLGLAQGALPLLGSTRSTSTAVLGKGVMDEEQNGAIISSVDTLLAQDGRRCLLWMTLITTATPLMNNLGHGTFSMS